MENKINIAELLKNCPKGMELDCVLLDGVKFNCIKENTNFPIMCFIEDENMPICFNKYGEYNIHNKAKCVIFPKGKTTWEGFVPSCKFKDGDIIYNRFQKRICIYRYHKKNDIPCIGYCRYNEYHKTFELLDVDIHIIQQDYRLATEEEKQKLFKAIKDNGYKWNDETNTLDKLIKPKFKVGDKIKHKFTGEIYKVMFVLSNVYDVVITNEIGKTINIKDQDDYELFELKFKVGDKIRLKDGDELGVITQILENCYKVENKPGVSHYPKLSYQDCYELVPNKFDISTLKPFDKVLVRNSKQKWTIDYFSFIDKKELYPFICAGHYASQCIPYEGNEHLLGTTNDCDEYFKTWK